MNQQDEVTEHLIKTIDHSTLTYSVKRIKHLEDHIYWCQIHLEQYIKTRDQLLAKLAGDDQEAQDLLLEKIEAEQ